MLLERAGDFEGNGGERDITTYCPGVAAPRALADISTIFVRKKTAADPEM